MEDARRSRSIRAARAVFAFTKTDDTPSATWNAVDHIIPLAPRTKTLGLNLRSASS